MFCPKCGNKLEDGALFCGSCGTPVGDGAEPKTLESDEQQSSVSPEQQNIAEPEQQSAEPAADEQQPADPAVTDLNVNEPAVPEVLPAKPKKSFLKKLRTPKGISALAAIAAVVAAAIIFANPIAAMFRRTFYSPEKYAEYVAEKTVGDIVGDIVPEKDKGTAVIMNRRVQGELSIIVSEELLDIVSQFGGNIAGDEYVGELIRLLNGLSLKVDASSKNRSVAYMYSLCSKGASLLSYKMSIDGENGIMYVEVPEAVDRAAYFDFKKMYDEAAEADPYLAERFNKLAELAGDEALRELIDRSLYDVLGNSLAKYVSAAFRGLDNVEKSRDELEVGDISEKCTLLEFDIDEKSVRGAIEEVIGEIENDKALLSLLDDIDQYILDREISDEKTDLKEKLLDGLDGLSDSLDDMEDDLGDAFENMKLKLKVWVSDDESIAGIAVEVKTGDENNEVFVYSVEDGKDSAIEIGARTGDEEIFCFSGEGKKSGSLMDGEYTLFVGGTELAALTVSDFDTKAFSNGILKGTFTVTPTQSLYDMFIFGGGSSVSGKLLQTLLSSLSLRVVADGDENSTDIKVTVVRDGKDLVGFRVVGSVSEADGISFPDKDSSYDLSDEDAMEAWTESIDLEAFANGLIDKLGLSDEYANEIKRFIKNSDILGSASNGGSDIPSVTVPEAGSGSSIDTFEAERVAIKGAESELTGKMKECDALYLVSTEEYIKAAAESEGMTFKEVLEEYYGVGSMSEYWDGYEQEMRDMLESYYGKNISVSAEVSTASAFSERDVRDFIEDYKEIFNTFGLDADRVSEVVYVGVNAEIEGSTDSETMELTYTAVKYAGSWMLFNLDEMINE